jgi:hypothetical protein
MPSKTMYICSAFAVSLLLFLLPARSDSSLDLLLFVRLKTMRAVNIRAIFEHVF